MFGTEKQVKADAGSIDVTNVMAQPMHQRSASTRLPRLHRVSNFLLLEYI